MKHEIRVRQVIFTKRMDGCFFRSQDLTLRLEIFGLRGLHTIPHLKSLDGAKNISKDRVGAFVTCACSKYYKQFLSLPSITSNKNKHHRPFTAPCGPSLLTKSHYFCFLPLSPQQEHISPTFGGPGNLRLGFCMHIHHPNFYVPEMNLVQLLRYTLSFANNPTFHGSYCALLDIVLERNILT